MQSWLEEKVLPIAVKIGNQRHLLAVRDTFIGMIAITMIASFAVLFNNIGEVSGFKWLGSLQKTIFGEGYKYLGGHIWWACFAFMAVYVCIGVAYKLAKSYGDNGFECMLVVLACFILTTPEAANVSITPEGAAEALTGSNWGLLNWGYVNQTAIFTALIIGLLATEVFIKLSKIKQLIIKMPEGVPPEVTRAFAKLVPGMLTIFTFAVLETILTKFLIKVPFNDWLNKILVTPLTGAADTLPFVLAVVFLVHFFWFFGLHGPNILSGITAPLFTALFATNSALYAKGVVGGVKAGYTVIGGKFLDAFVYLGGSGATIGLIIAMILFSRKRRKQMIALAGPTGVFQINEPIIFGMPIVLNFSWIIPFVLTPMVLTVISFLAIKSGLVNPVVIDMPWPTPPMLGAFIATGGDWKAIILALVNIVISTVIYTPFLLMANKAEDRLAGLEESSTSLTK